MTRATSLSAALLVATFGAPNPVGAQGRDVRASVQYQWLHLPGTSFAAGVSGEVSAVIRTPFVLLAEAGWASHETHVADLSVTARIVDFGAGLRLMPADSPCRPFVQLLAGGVGFHVDIGPKTAIAASVHVRRVFLDRNAFEAPGDSAIRALVGLSVQLAN
jgi:hypothetical protein